MQYDSRFQAMTIDEAMIAFPDLTQDQDALQPTTIEARQELLILILSWWKGIWPSGQSYSEWKYRPWSLRKVQKDFKSRDQFLMTLMKNLEKLARIITSDEKDQVHNFDLLFQRSI